MNTITKYKQKATVCNDKSCVTVYGETAEIVNGIVVMAALLISLGLIAKAFR
jgi:hypothetical protein